MSKTITTLALIGAAAVSAVAAGPASATSRATIDNCSASAQVAPHSLTLFCADAGSVLEKIRWSGWGNATATATATEVTDDCTPSCVAGHDVDKRVKVTVSGLRNGRYTKMTVGTQRWDLTKQGPVIA